MTCKEHLKYKGLQEPKAECLQCWKIYSNMLKIKIAILKDFFNEVEKL